MTRREKKSESLDIRLPFQQKQDFMAATRQNGETASQALRRFIAEYVEDARLAEHTNPVQEISMTLARHRFKTLATAAGAALGVFSIAALPSAADPNAFDALDKNKDGVLTEGEIAPGYDAVIIEALDADGSGGVSQEELEAAGNRVAVEHSICDVADDCGNSTKSTVKILRFSESEDGVIHGSVTTEIDRNIVVKRLESGSELSKAELESLIEQALSEADFSMDLDLDLDFDTETVFEETNEDGSIHVMIKRLKKTETDITSETDSDED